MSEYNEYYEWKQKPTPGNMSKLVKRYSGILWSELPKYKGNLPQGILRSYGKKYMIDAIRTFDPNKGKLANHIALNLRRLHRVNYDTSSVFRMSEELQRGVNLFKQTREFLEAKYKREPTDEELSEVLKWSPSKVARMKKQVKKEALSSSLEITPAFVHMEDPKIDYLYHDLPSEDKLIFQYRTGYRGAPILPVSQISKKINISPASVSNRALRSAKQIKTLMGEQ